MLRSGDVKQIDRVEVQWSAGERSEITGAFAASSRCVIHRRARAPKTP